MNRKRYRALFELHTVTDPLTGKPSRQARYIGTYHRIAALDTARARWGAGAVPVVLVSIGILLGYLFTDLPSTHSVWTLPLALLQLPPLFYWAWGVVATLRLPARFTEVKLEEGPRRIVRSAVSVAVLCALYAVGAAVLILTGGAGPRWLAETAWAAAMLVSGGLALVGARQAAKLDKAAETVP